MRLIEKEQIFNKELFNMKQNGFITKEMYDEISLSSNKYYYFKLNQVTPIPKLSIPSKVYSQEEITERKTSILLNLGVLFLFLSGLIFATTNWSNMEFIERVLAVIFMGSILAVGSYVADSILSLKKTGYALWILMTLYIPIVGITFIYSLLWNNGVHILESKSLIALTCISLISSVVNYLSIRKYKSKFYVWVTYVTSELTLLLFTSSLTVNLSCILLVMILSNLSIVYVYLKIKTEPYKLYTTKYLKFVSYIVLIITLMINPSVLDVAYIYALILLFPTLFITSRLIGDKYLKISAILYLFIKSILIVSTIQLNVVILIIPAIILYLVYYYDYKIKIDNKTGYMSLILSFALFNISAFSNDILCVIGIACIMIAGGIVYFKKKTIIMIQHICELLFPTYTYLFLVKIPFILIEDLSALQSMYILCIISVILSVIQFVVKNKYKNIKLCYGQVAVIVSMIYGLISMIYIQTMIIMLILLAVLQVIGLYKQLNKMSILVNFIISINIIINVSNFKNQYLNCVSIIMILGLFLCVGQLRKQYRKLLIFISSSFLFICAIIFASVIAIEWIILVLSLLIAIYALKSEYVESLLISALSIGINILFICSGVSLLKSETIPLIMTLYSVIIGELGSIYFKKFKSGDKYDSLTIAGIIILALTSTLNCYEYFDIIITTIGSLMLIGFNINKLKKSTTLKLFITLRLCLTYIQVLWLLDTSLNESFMIIPLIILAIVSRYWIFKGKKNGEICENILLILLNIKSLLFIFNSNLLNSIIIITIGIIIMIISYSKKAKSYFITSLIMIIPLLIRSTFNFWIMIPWLLYMLVFGIILIVLGSLAENKGKKIKDIKNILFKDWQ